MLEALFGAKRLKVAPDPERGFTIEGTAYLDLNGTAPGQVDRALPKSGSGGALCPCASRPADPPAGCLRARTRAWGVLPWCPGGVYDPAR